MGWRHEGTGQKHCKREVSNSILDIFKMEKLKVVERCYKEQYMSFISVFESNIESICTQ